MPRTVPARSHRFEARLDAETDALLTRAAQLTHESRSSFVVRAARAEADRVLGRGDVTLMSAELFDAMMASLDDAAVAPALLRHAERPRASRRA